MQSRHSTLSMAYTATTVEDPWVGEIIDRISGALERSPRDPREIFDRFCSPGSQCLQKADLSRAVKTFAPELPESHRSKLWDALSKGDAEGMDFEEFAEVFTVRGPQLGLDVEWKFVSLRYHQERVVQYRFGSALQNRSEAWQELQRICHDEEHGVKVHELLDICDRHHFPLSQQELLAFFMKCRQGEAVSLSTLEEALQCVADPSASQERTWAQQVLIAVGVQSRARGCSIEGELSQLGDAVAAFPDLRQALASHLSLDEDHWEVLKCSLDKRQDGDILLEPIVQLATQTCFDSEECGSGSQD